MGIVIQFPMKCAAAAPTFADEVRGLLLAEACASDMERGEVERDLIRRRMWGVLPRANARTVERCTELMLRMRAIMQEAVPL